MLKILGLQLKVRSNFSSVSTLSKQYPIPVINKEMNLKNPTYRFSTKTGTAIRFIMLKPASMFLQWFFNLCK